MIYGIGIDIVRIERIKKAVDRWEKRFLERIFTGREIEFCYRKKEPYRSLAVRFAAKEALIKAISAEIAVSMKDIEIVTSQGGKPSLKISGSLESFFSGKSIRCAHLTLSHEHDYGVACVVLEAKQ